MQPIINSIDPRNLKDHPLNAKVYGDHADEKFVESCRNGITEHLHITADNVIISGHRRRQAAIRIGMAEVPVIIRTDLKDEMDIEKALLLANEYRDKTVEQRAREGKELERIEAELAKRRRAATQIKDGSPPVSTVRPNLDAPENKAKNAKNGRSDEKAAAAVGMSKDTLRKAVEVVDAIDEAEAEGDTETAEELRETLNNKSVSAAHKKAKKPQEEQPIRHVMEEQVVEPDPAQKVKEFGKPFDAIVKKIGEAIADFGRIKGTPGGDFVDSFAIQEMTTKGRNLQEVVKARRPKIHKPCEGKGCKTCNNLGYTKG